MALGEELKKLDPEKIDEIFNDLLDPAEQTLRSELHEYFLRNEVLAMEQKYPSFPIISSKFKELAPELIAEGVSEEQIRGVYRGILIAQLILSIYADRELTDL
jgi:hypothetical protein